ncbi:MAG: hypothetical protein AB7M05_02230 [Alphaproteobacteria bacterium]
MDAIDIVIILFLVWWICANARSSGKERGRLTVLGTLRDYVWPGIDEISARTLARDIPGYSFFLALYIAAELVLGLYHGEIEPADYALIAEYLVCMTLFGIICRYAKERLWTLLAFPASVLAMGAGRLLRGYFDDMPVKGTLVVAAIFAPLIVSQFRAWLWLIRFGPRGDAAPAGEP